MQDTYQLVQGDREVIRGTLSHDDEALDLTGRTVTPVLTHFSDGRLDLQGGVEVVDAAGGEIEATLEPEDLGRIGTHYLEFRVTDDAGDPTTIPKDEPILLDVRQSKGLIEQVAETLRFGALSTLDIDVAKDWAGHRIRNLGDPQEPQDATTRSWVEGDVDSSITTHRTDDVHDVAQPPLEHADEAHSKAYYSEGDDAVLGSVVTDEATHNPDVYSYTGDQAPVNIGVTNNSRAINIQAQTDDQPLGSFGNIYWISAAGERFATIVGNTDDDPNGDLAIYTKEDPLGSGDTGLRNRFELRAGSNQTNAGFWNLNILRFDGEQPDFEITPSQSTSDVDTRIWFNDHTTTRRWVIRRRGSNAGQLAITNLDGNGDILSFETDGQIDQHGNDSKNVVWRSGASGSRPSTPVEGQRYFDSDLGQPIWYDGTDWVDATGTVV